MLFLLLFLSCCVRGRSGEGGGGVGNGDIAMMLDAHMEKHRTSIDETVRFGVLFYRVPLTLLLLLLL